MDYLQLSKVFLLSILFFSAPSHSNIILFSAASPEDVIYGRELTSIIDNSVNNHTDFRNHVRQQTKPLTQNSITNQDGQQINSTIKDGEVSFWVNGNRRWEKQSENHGVFGYDSRANNLSTGIRTQLNETWSFTVAAQYDDNKIDFNNNPNIKIEAKGFQTGLFLSNQTKDVNLLMGIQYGHQRNKMHYWPITSTTSSYDKVNTDIYGANIEIGIPVQVEQLTFTPYFGVNYGHYRMDAIDEQGDPAETRHFDATHINLIEFPVGISFNHAIYQQADFFITTLADISYVTTTGDDVVKTKASFTRSPEDVFSVEGYKRARETLRGKVGLGIRLEENSELNAYYGLEKRSHFISQQMGVAVKFQY